MLNSDFFPDELYMALFCDSQPEALVKAFRIDRKANRVLRDDSLWKAHLTHLRGFIQEQDNFNPALTMQQAFVQRYAQYFHLLAKIQQDEINHFLSLESELKTAYPSAQEELTRHFKALAVFTKAAPAKTLEELTQRAKLVDGPIDELNAIIIRPVIAKAREDYQDELNLDGQKITRVPECLIDDVNYNEFFQTIETLRVNNNPLTRLPLNINKFASLKTLAASNTTLAFLPYTMAKLTQLNTLIVNNNHLLSLPENLGDLPSLQRLFAANNQLTELPVSLAKLKYLNALNLSNNQLTGFNFVLPRLVKLGLNTNQLKELALTLRKALYCFETSKIQSVDEVLDCQKKLTGLKP